jgi:CTP:molybdopterin cytidylyltransferase MocA
VLAAGAGTRYGGPKILAHGGAWLEAVVRALVEAGCAPVHVVVGAAEAAMPPGAIAIRAADWRAGLSASLRCGLESLRGTGASAVVVLPVDIPDASAGTVRRVLAHAGCSGLARAVYNGVPGHPVLIGREHWQAVLHSLHGDSGARGYLDGRADVVLVECADLANGADCDYP